MNVVTHPSTNPARPGLTSELVYLTSLFLDKVFSQTPISPPSDFLLSVFSFNLASRVTAIIVFLVTCVINVHSVLLLRKMRMYLPLKERKLQYHDKASRVLL